MRRICHFHSDEDWPGTWSGPETGYVFTCEISTGHPAPGPYVFFGLPEPSTASGQGGLAGELDLDVRLPEIVEALTALHGDLWFEYGVIEHAYALAYPDDWAMLVEKYGHTALAAARYTASSFLGAALGRQGAGALRFAWKKATGHWSYNSRVGWYAVPGDQPPTGDYSWEGTGLARDHVPGLS